MLNKYLIKFGSVVKHIEAGNHYDAVKVARRVLQVPFAKLYMMSVVRVEINGRRIENHRHIF
jgi:hypothetical protein